MISQSEEKFPVIEDEDGFECDDIDRITKWINSSLNEIILNNKYYLVGVNFSTYGASLMFLDKQGKPITPGYNYLKEISPAISENLFAEYGGKDKFCRKTASPALGLLLNSGIQILWLKNEKPGIYNKYWHRYPRQFCIIGTLPESIGRKIYPCFNRNLVYQRKRNQVNAA